MVCFTSPYVQFNLNFDIKGGTGESKGDMI